MNLQAMLAARVEAGKPVRVGLIGAGKFGSRTAISRRSCRSTTTRCCGTRGRTRWRRS